MYMKTLLSLLLLTTPVHAQSQPFTYTTQCALETTNEFLIDNCKVIETRESNGALKSRNIFSNRFSLTIKSWFDKTHGFVTWDSHNKYKYKWEYVLKPVGDLGNWSVVMPGVYLKDVSWD